MHESSRGTCSLYRTSFYALGGYNEIQLHAHPHEAGERAAVAAIERIKSIEDKYSRYLPGSIVSRINSSAGLEPVCVDQETAALLDYSETCFLQSDGLFDVTSGVLRRAWDFRTARIPTEEEIRALLPLIGWHKVEWKRPYLYLPVPGMQIDFGGFGKEYAVDCACTVLEEHGIRSGFVNLGGDVRVIGPRPDESPWAIGVAHPRKRGNIMAFIQLTRGALATSGDYERYFEYQGRRFSHILNPKGGWPVQGAQSVTVICGSCLVAGSISTMAMLLGQPSDLDFLRSLQVRFVLVCENGDIEQSQQEVVLANDVLTGCPLRTSRLPLRNLEIKTITSS